MNACRQTLSAAVTALADEVEILDQAPRPVQRLGEPTNDLERLDREIALAVEALLLGKSILGLADLEAFAGEASIELVDG